MNIVLVEGDNEKFHIKIACRTPGWNMGAARIHWLIKNTDIVIRRDVVIDERIKFHAERLAKESFEDFLKLL